MSIPGRTSLGAGRLVCLPEGRSYLVGAVPLTIGREPSSNVPVHSEEASRTHAYILVIWVYERRRQTRQTT